MLIMFLPNSRHLSPSFSMVRESPKSPPPQNLASTPGTEFLEIQEDLH